MKIIKLKSENIKRLSAVEITPDGTLVTVGGKNGAGKSSVLDSIAYALGGEKLVPSEPIRSGEDSARIQIDLGDYIVTRRFYRERAACNCLALRGDGENDQHVHTKECASHVWGETKSVLVVANRQGAHYPSPQALLDKLYGKLTFDPLAFSREKEDKQNAILKQLAGLDFRLLDVDRTVAFERRAMARKTVTAIETRLASMVFHTDAPSEIVPLQTITDELKRARELQQAATESRRTLEYAQNTAREAQRLVDAKFAQIQELERTLTLLREDHAELLRKVPELEETTRVAELNFNEATSRVPDFGTIELRLSSVQADNKRVEQNQTYTQTKDELQTHVKEFEAFDKQIKSIDQSKADALLAAKFPVEGLGLTETGVTFEGLPFAEVSSSVQLRVSVAIGLALNPTLKVLLIRNGNLLDEDSLKAVAQQAEAAGAQVWMEYVTSHADGVSVMLEDGHVAE